MDLATLWVVEETLEVVEVTLAVVETSVEEEAMVVEVVAAEGVMEEVMVDIMDLEVMVSFVMFFDFIFSIFLCDLTIKVCF